MIKLKKWLCRKFGHKFNHAELMTLDIMQNHAINKHEFRGETINCKRCGVPCSYTEMVGLYENPDEMDLV
jgi:hypothetical protein